MKAKAFSQIEFFWYSHPTTYRAPFIFIYLNSLHYCCPAHIVSISWLAAHRLIFRFQRSTWTGRCDKRSYICRFTCSRKLVKITLGVVNTPARLSDNALYQHLLTSMNSFAQYQLSVRILSYLLVSQHAAFQNHIESIILKVGQNWLTSHSVFYGLFQTNLVHISMYEFCFMCKWTLESTEWHNVWNAPTSILCFKNSHDGL